jgi:hypothetical protein
MAVTSLLCKKEEIVTAASTTSSNSKSLAYPYRWGINLAAYQHASISHLSFGGK